MMKRYLPLLLPYLNEDKAAKAKLILAALALSKGAGRPIEDKGNYFSTGNRDLDDLLGGGYRKGSYNVVEIGDNVSITQYHKLRPIQLIFIRYLNYQLRDSQRSCCAACMIQGRPDFDVSSIINSTR